jgi:inorganic pyrophosphatase
MDAKVVGVMQMVEWRRSRRIKSLPLLPTIQGVNHYNNIEELPKHFFDELRHFFEEYKKLENKTVVASRRIWRQSPSIKYYKRSDKFL